MKLPEFKGEDTCPGRNHPQRHGGPYLTAPSSAHPRLLVSGPADDGFWVRTHHVMAMARWVERARIPLLVAHNSSTDAYYDPRSMGSNACELQAPA